VGAAYVLRGGGLESSAAQSKPAVSHAHYAVVAPAAAVANNRAGLPWRWGSVASIVVAAAFAARRVRVRWTWPAFSALAWRGAVKRRGPPALATLI